MVTSVQLRHLRCNIMTLVHGVVLSAAVSRTKTWHWVPVLRLPLWLAEPDSIKFPPDISAEDHAAQIAVEVSLLDAMAAPGGWSKERMTINNNNNKARHGEIGISRFANKRI